MVRGEVMTWHGVTAAERHCLTCKDLKTCVQTVNCGINAAQREYAHAKAFSPGLTTGNTPA